MKLASSKVSSTGTEDINRIKGPGVRRKTPHCSGSWRNTELVASNPADQSMPTDPELVTSLSLPLPGSNNSLLRRDKDQNQSENNASIFLFRKPQQIRGRQNSAPELSMPASLNSLMDHGKLLMPPPSIPMPFVSGIHEMALTTLQCKCKCVLAENGVRDER